MIKINFEAPREASSITLLHNDDVVLISQHYDNQLNWISMIVAVPFLANNQIPPLNGFVFLLIASLFLQSYINISADGIIEDNKKNADYQPNTIAAIALNP